MGECHSKGCCAARGSQGLSVESVLDDAQETKDDDDRDIDLDDGDFGSDASIDLLNDLEVSKSNGSGGKQGVAVKSDAYSRPLTSLANLASEIDAFKGRLIRHGIDTSTWTTSVERLWWEAEKRRWCLLVSDEASGKMRRIVSLVKIRVTSDIFGVEHVLYSRLQVCKDGRSAERRQLPLRRLAWRRSSGKPYEFDDQAYYSELCPYTEDWVQGCRRALKDRLGLSYEWQAQHLEDKHTHTFHAEDVQSSNSFPGLHTLYAIHEVTFHVGDPTSAEVGCIGLPNGQEFATEGPLVGRGRDKIGRREAQLNLWTWVRSSGKSGVIKRVPIPTHCGNNIADMRWKAEERGHLLAKPPNGALWMAQSGRHTRWDTVEQMSRRIGDPEYGLNSFCQDLSAFPELDLYLMDGSLVPGGSSKVLEGCLLTGSGRTIGDEYQRTMGAFFAIFWLLRLGIGGKEGFTFGVDDEYQPIKPDAGEEPLYRPAEQRLKFHRETPWDQFESLFVDAEVLITKGADGSLKPNVRRVKTLLALTAVHDIMKVQTLLPTVQPEHAPYHGYKANDVIGDHDHALSYVMDHYPELLPSYAGLCEEERRSVQFTQCELCFNQGWLVQGEAPPGAIFTKFRQLLQQEKMKKVESKDVSLYFVHWLTDLAGAEPTPLGGCEKFVTKFPLPVLTSFLKSFHVVKQIATRTETQVYEDYLKMRWAEISPSLGLGPVPFGPDAIVRMRLLCMSQMNSEPILEAWPSVPKADWEILCEEMSRTGCVGQAYSHGLVPQEIRATPRGPALLIYYGPAFLQSLGSDNPVKRLRVLAAIYRASRALWPLTAAAEGQWVTVRIDTLKGMSVADIQEAAGSGGDLWTLARKNHAEAFVERTPKQQLAALIAKSEGVEALEISTLT